MTDTSREAALALVDRLEYKGHVGQAAKDLIDRYFGKTDKCLASIPARPDVDADLVLTSGLEKAAALIRALVDERDAANRVAEMNATSGGFYARQAERATALRERVKVLEEALIPISRLPHDPLYPDDHLVAVTISYAQIRRARAALKDTP